MARAFEPSLEAVRQVLLRDWDPHGVYERPEGHGAYDGWVEPVWALVAGGADEEGVMDWLQERERETMCFPSIGRERLRRVARRLIGVINGNAQ